MAGHGEKLTRKQEAAIAALLSEPTVEAAAARAEIGHQTLKQAVVRLVVAGGGGDSLTEAIRNLYGRPPTPEALAVGVGASQLPVQLPALGFKVLTHED
jgi:hypothetical protein